MAQGGPVAIEYAVRHPEQVARLVFYGSYAGATVADLARRTRLLDETFTQLIKVGWERPTPEFRRVFTYLMIPGATEEQMGWLDELQRRPSPPRSPSRPGGSAAGPTPAHLLGALDVPTLVLHSLGDRMNAFAYSRYLASEIPGARLVALESDNHIVLEDEPAWPVFLREVTEFLAEDDAAGPPCRRTATSREVLSAREIEVLAARRPGPRQRRHRRRADPQRPHRRAAPPEHLRQARPAREVRARRRGRAVLLAAGVTPPSRVRRAPVCAVDGWMYRCATPHRSS